jgi:iron(III) transport system substrate-binding protein
MDTFLSSLNKLLLTINLKPLKSSLMFSLLLLLSACGETPPQLVVFTSVDQIFSEPILKQFQSETGIQVKAVYDTEAAKTVGLEKRLLAEKDNPVADVFWNSEHLRTMRLNKAGLFMPYKGASFDSIPSDFKDPDGYWTGFGARYRVLIVNNSIVSKDQLPNSLDDLLDIKWKGQIAFAKPYFGTTSTHFAALYAHNGEETFKRFLNKLKENEAALLSGNSTVRDAVVRGEYAFGLTDTDDVSVAIDRGENVSMIFADNYGNGAYAIPHTAAMIANGPNPENAKKFIDFLQSKKVMGLLVKSGAVHGPIRDGLDVTLKYDQPEKFWLESSPAILDALKPSAELARQILDK